jgi:hypothetical protein
MAENQTRIDPFSIFYVTQNERNRLPRNRKEGQVGGPVGQRKGKVLIPGRSRMTRECILLNSGSETLNKVQEALKSGKL